MQRKSEEFGWNYGDLFDDLDKFIPNDTPALIHGDSITCWGDMRARTNNMASNLRADGFEADEKIAFYLRNHSSYCEGVIAAVKARLAHVNVNYRYTPEELNYILSDSDSAVVIFGREFSGNVIEMQGLENDVRLWLYVEDGSGAQLPPFAKPFEDYASKGDGAPLDITRSPDDQVLMYTGGTTGLPKGVLWSQNALRQTLLIAGDAPKPPKDNVEHIEQLKENGLGASCLIAPPLMHGTGIFTALSILLSGGSVVTMESPGLDATELWTLVAKHRVKSMIIVGDAFARPMLRVLDENPDRFDLSCVQAIGSSGTIWSLEIKKAILKHLPHCALIDSYGSSEGMALGKSIMTADGEIDTAKFTIGAGVTVLSEDGRKIKPGSGEKGLIARSEPIPLGYYKDEDKTAQTFKTIAGVRYSIPGDYCTVDADGSITLIGRGSGCINTGGEKVFPEEVEEVLKRHDVVEDALVFGLPDEQWGQVVTAVVEQRADSKTDETRLQQYVRGQLAGYKIPKRILSTSKMFRAENGKADYQSAKKFAKKQIATEAKSV